MVANPPQGVQRISPYLFYDDAAAAIDYLCRTFGFEERFRMAGPDGKVMHAELAHHDSIVSLANTMDDMQTASPNALEGRHSMNLVYVDDVDAHCARAKEAGAKILAEPTDQFYGDRTYQAEDPEGHFWYFHQHVRDVAPEDMQPPTES